MRHLTLVGRVYHNPKVIRLARRCAWCRRWFSSADYIAAHRDGARVTHGICKSCEREHFPEIPAGGPPAKPAA